MKKQEHLFEAIGQVDDRLVEEAADARRMATPWKKWVAMAASLVLVIGLSASSLALLFRGCGSSDSAASQNATASDTADTAGMPETDGATEEGTATEDTATDDTATDGGDTGESASPGENAGSGTDTGAAAEPLVLSALWADADGLTAKRAVTVCADEHTETGENMLVILDSYTLTASENVDTVLHYAAVSADATYTVTVNQTEETVTENAGEISFPLTLAAGEEVTVNVTVVIPAGPDGVAGFALSTDSTNVTVTEQGAALDLERRTDTEILINDFGESDGIAELEPSGMYQLELRFLS